MLDAFAQILWLVMRPCYELFSNWWIAIFLFTCIFRVVTFPISLWVQSHAINMVKMMPELNAIKIRFFGDKAAIGDAQSKLYKTKKYHPLLSMLPLAIQIIVLIGLVHLMQDVTTSHAPGTEFLGMVPIIDGGISWIMPFLAGGSALILGLVQNKLSPLQREQGRKEQAFTNGLSIAISLLLGVFVSAGMAFYWICSNLTTIIVQAVANLVMKPATKIDYPTLRASQEELEELNRLDADRPKRRLFDALSRRERRDFKRFFKIANKHIVFYSEGEGFYKYFENTIGYLHDYCSCDIHYVTNDPDDIIFDVSYNHTKIRPYYIGPKKAITLMMKMDADIVVTTLDDLGTYHIKRSYVKSDVKYVLMFHHMTSTHLTSTETAYDSYDALLCVGQHQIDEIRASEKLRGLKAKELVKCGYPLLDEVTHKWSAEPGAAGPRRSNTVLLIAPSWQDSCILDTCIDEMLEVLTTKDYYIILRPHPEYVKRYGARWEAIKTRWSKISQRDLRFDEDFTSNKRVLMSDILITDWSTIFCEYCFSSNRPAIFIDTPMKVGNENWEALDIVPTDISLRNEVGVSIALDEIATISDVVAEMIENEEKWKSDIDKVADKTIFNRGFSSEVAGEYLLEEIIRAQEKRSGSQKPQ